MLVGQSVDASNVTWAWLKRDWLVSVSSRAKALGPLNPLGLTEEWKD